MSENVSNIENRIKTKVTYKDIAPLLNRFASQAQTGIYDVATLFKEYVKATTTYSDEQIEELTLDELDEIVRVLAQRYPLEKLTKLFLALQGQ